ncbi:dsRBD fold-containing protein [Streptomyces griseoflavus]|uniref:dsRBD fold-containing protein n=1 Tax=Streptomyces griseoflavus TaxID=35619 RepID=UPI0033A6E40B
MAHTTEWRVRLHLFEDDDGTTKAHVVLDTGTTAFTCHGTAHCHPADADVPEIGDELAAGRALRNIAQRLLDTAERDIAGHGVAAARHPADHRTAHVTRRPSQRDKKEDRS